MKIRTHGIVVYLSTRFSRLISFLLFWDRSAVKNNFGSYISPTESKIAEDLGLHVRLSPLMERLRTQRIDTSLIRIGSEADGGYVVLDKEYRDSFLVSGGISTDNKFEVDLANLGAKALQIDYSIVAPPSTHPNLTFTAKRLVGEESREFTFDVTLDEIVTQIPNNKDLELILKLDIEGSEWDILETSNVLNRFNQICLELHYLDRLANPKYEESSLRALNNLLESFFPVFITGNNCCGFVTLGGFVLPRVMELTLLNRNSYSPLRNSEISINQKFQSKNYPDKAPLVLKNW